MFFQQKRLFAGKQKLQYEPFCPCMSNESGFLSLRNNSAYASNRSGTAFKPRPVYRDGKRNV